MNDTHLSETLGLIYDVAVAPDRWPDLLRRLARDFDCHFGAMNISSANRDQCRAMAVGVDRAEHQEFVRRFNQTNPITLRFRPGLANEMIEALAVITRTEMERLEMYQSFYRPNDMGHTAKLTILAGPAGTQSIAISRSWRNTRFDEREHSLARLLIPHLRRAALVARQIRNADLLTKAAHSTLDAAAQSVFLLDRAGRLIHANRRAKSLLRMNDGLKSRRDNLVAATPAATAALEALIAAAAAHPGDGGTLRLPRPSGKASLIALAIPIRGLSDFFFIDQPAVILCASDPATREAIDESALTALFGLTHAEAKLASQILAGEALSAIAAASGRSVHTVRNLLVRVMAKTETSRQSELVGLLSQLPRID